MYQEVRGPSKGRNAGQSANCRQRHVCNERKLPPASFLALQAQSSDVPPATGVDFADGFTCKLKDVDEHATLYTRISSFSMIYHISRDLRQHYTTRTILVGCVSNHWQFTRSCIPTIFRHFRCLLRYLTYRYHRWSYLCVPHTIAITYPMYWQTLSDFVSDFIIFGDIGYSDVSII